MSRPETITITHPTAVDLLSSISSLRFLSPFFTATHSLGSAAAALTCSPSTLAYWLPRFVDAGLLQHDTPLPRRGPPIPRYRTTATRFVVPLEVVPFDRRVEFLDSGRSRLLRRFLDGLDENLLATQGYALGFTAPAAGGVDIQMVEPPPNPATGRPGGDATADMWSVLHLSHADAAALSKELEAVYRRYEAKHGPHEFICHFGLAPEPRVRWRSAND